MIKRHVMKARSLKERERGGVGKGHRDREGEREGREKERERATGPRDPGRTATMRVA